MNLTGSSSTTSSNYLGCVGTTTTNFSQYGDKYLIDTVLYDWGMELVFRQDPSTTYTFYAVTQVPLIFKEVYKIVDGKLKLTETVNGRYIPARGETYEFD